MKQADRNELRSLALNAKKRMKSGYWQKTNEQRVNAIATMRSMGRSPILAQNYYANKLHNEFYAKNKIYSEDEALYQKVCKMLDESSDVSNPIGILVDKDFYEKLDTNAKQRYVFKLADKYRTLKERYYIEKQMCSR